MFLFQRPDPSAGEVASVTAKLTECQTQLNSLTQDNTRLVTEHDTLKREKTAMQTEKVILWLSRLQQSDSW